MTRPGGARSVVPVALLLFGSGLCALVYQVVWFRLLRLVFGASTPATAAVTAAFMGGIGLGSLLLGERAERHARPLALYARLELGIALAALASPWLLSAARSVYVAAGGTLALGTTVGTVGRLLLAAVVLGVPTVLMGGTLPAAARAVAGGTDRGRRRLGLLYGANTLGAVAATLATTLWAVEVLGLRTTLATAGLLNLLAALALLAWASASPGGRRRGWAALLVAVAAIACLWAEGPTAFWRHSAIGAGRLDLGASDPNATRAKRARQRSLTLWEADGLESSLAAQGVIDYAFLVNGKADGSARSDASTQVLSGLVGAALHPDPRRALVIGLGTGSTAGWLAEVPSLERVDVVEIEPAILRVAADCAAVNHDVLRHANVHLILGDAREILLTSRERYDVVLSEPSNPYRAGISSLFSQDFYRAVAERIGSGGPFLQWLQGYEVDAQVVRTAYATLRSVFPVVESWEISRADLLLVASATPVDHDPARLAARLAGDPWRAAMGRIWGVEGLAGLYAAHLAGPELADALAASERGRLDTDDPPLLELGFARNLGRRGLFRIADLAAMAGGLGSGLPARVRAALDPTELADVRSARQLAVQGAPAAPAGAGQELAARVRARQAFRRGDIEAACDEWGSQPGAPGTPIDRLLLAECLAERGDARALPLLEALERTRPADARLVAARWSAARGDWRGAGERLDAALAALTDDPWAFPPTLSRALELSPAIARGDPEAGRRLFARLREPLPVYLLEERRRRLLVELARAIDFPGLCVAAFAAAEPFVPWERDMLLARADCYRRAGDARAGAALADFGRFLAASPPALEAGLPGPATPR